MITQVLDRQLYPESIDKPSLYQIINQANILAACSLPHLEHAFDFDRRRAQSSLFQILYIIIGGMGVWVAFCMGGIEAHTTQSCCPPRAQAMLWPRMGFMQGQQ